MALSKVPVISVGLTPYYGLGIVSEPNTKNDYKKFIQGKLDEISKLLNDI